MTPKCRALLRQAFPASVTVEKDCPLVFSGDDPLRLNEHSQMNTACHEIRIPIRP
jgi:hypothetical protein